MSARPDWVPDNAQDNCTKCQVGFGFFKRRHHCRGCGKIFCYDCCVKLLLLPENFGYPQPERVCDVCFRKHSSVDFNQHHEVIGVEAQYTIVLLHPALYSRKAFARQVEMFSPNYALLIPDLPGHGSRIEEKFTMDRAVEDVAALIQATVPTGKALIFGVHLGGYVAMLLAAKRPDLCAGLIVVSACTTVPVNPYTEAKRTRIAKLDEILLRPGLNEAKWGECFSSITAYRYDLELSRYKGPVLFINGEKQNRDAEKSFTSACQKQFLRVIAGADHLVAFDDRTYEKVNQYAQEFAVAIGWKGTNVPLQDSNPFYVEDKHKLYST